MKGPLKKAPAGLYTANEAIQKLRMPRTTFHHYVRTGKIKKVVPPGRTEGFYEKAYIDKMARASELFALQYAAEATQFSVAAKEDAQGVYEVIASLWGSLNTTPVETRLEWYKTNPLIDYVVKQDDIIAGYVTIMPLKHEVLEKLMSGEIRGWDIKASDILPFEPGSPVECYTGIAVRAGMYKTQKYGTRLLSGIIDTLTEMGKQGIIITKLYAVSDTPNGIKLSQGLGFEEKPPAEGSRFNQYVLDLEKAQTPFAKAYREALQEYKENNTTNSTQNNVISDRKKAAK